MPQPHPLALERREHPRYKIHAIALVEWKTDGVTHSARGWTRDISLKGACIAAKDTPPPPLNANLKVRILFTERHIPKATLLLNSTGRVLRTAGDLFAILNEDAELQRGADIATVAEALADSR
jgi:hypothetical protein